MLLSSRQLADLKVIIGKIKETKNEIETITENKDFQTKTMTDDIAAQVRVAELATVVPATLAYLPRGGKLVYYYVYKCVCIEKLRPAFARFLDGQEGVASDEGDSGHAAGARRKEGEGRCAGG